MSVSDLSKYFSSFGEKTTLEINGTLRECYETNVPYRKLIEGIGYVQTNWEHQDNEYLSFANFINLSSMEFGNHHRVLSHVIENGNVVFKGELYNFFVENGLNPETDSDIPIIEE